MLWRVRTSLSDRPGSLARVAATCGENGLNILAVQIFPEIGNVVDELVVECADTWSGDDLARIVAEAGGSTVTVSPCGSKDLVDEPIRWLRAAERMVRAPDERGRIMADLTGPESDAWSFSENARISALLDVVAAAGRLEPADAETEAVVYEVLPDTVLARVGEQVVATATLERTGATTVSVSQGWRRRGIGRALFVMVAGVARHSGLEEIVLVAPADELSTASSEGGATLAMLDSLGLRGLIRLKDGTLQIRISLADIRPLAPRPAPEAAEPPKGGAAVTKRAASDRVR